VLTQPNFDSPRYNGINPYALGFAMFRDIRRICEAPTDEEFDEYVAYAVECRRRVKEQMNKRKPDDEFANIELSFFDRAGKEVVVHCPESVGASATLEPARRRIRSKNDEAVSSAPTSPSPSQPSSKDVSTFESPAPAAEQVAPVERHYTIGYGDTGHSYDTIFRVHPGSYGFLT
jgi:ATP-dependent Lon protease